eukprot:jgi/Mesvir1/11823/Mv00175-RA.1
MLNSNNLLIPPFRYAIVEPGVYRGAYPTLKNFRFLRRLRLKTIISLTPETQQNRDLTAFCEHEGIEMHHFFVERFQQEAVTLATPKVLRILQLVICVDHHPLYLHCLDGTNVTGLVVMCLRKLQNWRLSASTTEFCRFQREGAITREESQFVESFRGEIVIPPVIPKWLWNASRTVSHPAFRLKLMPAPATTQPAGGTASKPPTSRNSSAGATPNYKAGGSPGGSHVAAAGQVTSGSGSQSGTGTTASGPTKHANAGNSPHAVAASQLQDWAAGGSSEHGGGRMEHRSEWGDRGGLVTEVFSDVAGDIALQRAGAWQPSHLMGAQQPRANKAAAMGRSLDALLLEDQVVHFSRT